MGLIESPTLNKATAKQPHEGKNMHVMLHRGYYRRKMALPRLTCLMPIVQPFLVIITFFFLCGAADPVRLPVHTY